MIVAIAQRLVTIANAVLKTGKPWRINTVASRPGNADISWICCWTTPPTWPYTPPQAYFRQYQPPLMTVWGRCLEARHPPRGCALLRYLSSGTGALWR
ncbi:hypothetical protein AA0313_2911 [Acetobacter indonesiensis NRIC 0313]|uniref:Transposase n=1 Tax=Acetobacter indonesiensis TaxID=104101 RepID=A0A6N3T5Y1_9PROT|nr:hypothetical protein Abin_012_031 [Acetobacter indonesiensis]GBQ62186.1 hypothetical protein AA0313_2911 [Acetobacter indonesiensis NRIC 0313]GEN04612.1 hypothetical protein AIN02nite_26370 [Acetobacter indonesiensis]